MCRNGLQSEPCDNKCKLVDTTPKCFTLQYGKAGRHDEGFVQALGGTPVNDELAAITGRSATGSSGARVPGTNHLGDQATVSFSLASLGPES